MITPFNLDPEAAEGRVRLDVWLWRARLFKTRALAAVFVARAGIRLERPGSGMRRIDKPACPLAPGDRISFARDGQVFHAEIRATGIRRGPPAEARALYRDLTAVAPAAGNADGPASALHSPHTFTR